jgi:hypothetical protein
VIDIQIASMRIYDPETGRHMFQGAARLEVTVYAAGVEEARHVYTNETQFPDKPADMTDASAYKAKFVEQIVNELTARHTEHTHDSRVAPLRPGE